jgi:hypothetical protein
LQVNKDERIAELEDANARQTTVSILQSDLINELRREVNLLKDCLKLQSKYGSLVPGVIKLLRENMKCESSSPSLSPSPAPQPVPGHSAEQPEPLPLPPSQS